MFEKSYFNCLLQEIDSTEFGRWIVALEQTDSVSHGYFLRILKSLRREALEMQETVDDDINNIQSVDSFEEMPRLILNTGKDLKERIAC